MNYLVFFTDPHAVCKSNSCIFHTDKYPGSLLFLDNMINQCILPVSFVDQFVHSQSDNFLELLAVQSLLFVISFVISYYQHAYLELPNFTELFSPGFHFKIFLMHIARFCIEFLIYCCLAVLGKLCRALC